MLATLVFISACSTDEEAPPAPAAAEPVEADTTITLVLSGTRTEHERESRLSVDMTYPQLNPSARPDLAHIFDQINAQIVERMSSEVDSFLVWARESAAITDATLGGESSLEGGFSDAFINDRVFSTRQHMYSYTLGAAHPNTTTIVHNFDLGTGEVLALEDLFESGTAYLDTLSLLTQVGLFSEAESRGFAASDLWEDGYAAQAENFERFTIGVDSLAIHFPPYSVAPYVAGDFEVCIPYTRLGGVLRSGGPAASLTSE